MSNNWFQFKQFKILQDKAEMKVGIDSVLLGSIASFTQPKEVLDIGSGTGLLALMAEQRTNAKVTAIEIEKNAYEQCVENVVLNKKEESIKVIHNSFQNFANTCFRKFDHIISNPPFFNGTYLSNNQNRNMVRHTIFLSEEDLYSGIIKCISENGKFSIIIPADRIEEHMQLSAKYGIYCFKIVDVFPTIEKQANRKILEFSTLKKNIVKEKIIIRNYETNSYSDHYRRITKDFYLSF